VLDAVVFVSVGVGHRGKGWQHFGLNQDARLELRHSVLQSESRFLLLFVSQVGSGAFAWAGLSTRSSCLCLPSSEAESPRPAWAFGFYSQIFEFLYLCFEMTK
jgi:hypothetical protein